MGKPQGLGFLLDVILKYRNNSEIFFIFVGRGSEKKNIKKFIINKNLNNLLLIDNLARDEYEKLVCECDIGLINLDKRFTVPNYPSRVLTYFEYGLPVMAAIDSETDFGELLDKSKAGFWVVAGDIENYCKKFNKLLYNKNLREKMGKAGRSYIEKFLNVENSYELFIKQVRGKVNV